MKDRTSKTLVKARGRQPSSQSLLWFVRGGRLTGGVEPGHVALDIGAPIGSPVYAPVGGRVTAVRMSERGYGLNIRILTPQGIEQVFAHLSRALVSPGQNVQAGQIIGQVGSTGRSTGPHLHYEVRMPGPDVFQPAGRARSTTTALDPFDFLRKSVTGSIRPSAIREPKLDALFGAPTTVIAPSQQRPAANLTALFAAIPGISIAAGARQPGDAEARAGLTTDVIGVRAATERVITTVSGLLPRAGLVAVGILLALTGFVILAVSYREVLGEEVKTLAKILAESKAAKAKTGKAAAAVTVAETVAAEGTA